MASASSGKSRSQKDKMMAAYMKAVGIERTRGICAACYRLIPIESSQSRYKHICHGGK